MLRQIASVGGLTMVSRIVGFVRDILLAAILGAGPVADAFFIAFRLPNNFRTLFAEGAFNAAFVPQFAGLLATEGKGPAKLFAERMLSLMIIVQLVLLVVFLAIMPWFMLIYAPGFSEDPPKFALAVEFTRITFPYLLFISLVVLQGGILNSMNRFTAAAAAPILMNFCFVAAMLALAPLLPTAGHALAWGCFVAGVVQFVYLAYEMHRAGVSLDLRLPRITPEVSRFWRVVGPASLGAGVTQISLFFDSVVASMLPTGAVSYLYYADRLNQFPLGVIGVAVGTVLLPQLARQLRTGNSVAAADSQNRAIEYCLLLTLPAVAAFMAVAFPLIDGLFRRGAFSTEDAAATAAVLRAYALGLPAFTLVKCLVPGFYAREDTRTPVKVAMASVATNIVLKLLLMGPMGATGVALATSVAAWVNAGLLGAILYRRGHLAFDARLKRRFPRMLLASAGVTLILAVLDAPLAGATASYGRVGDMVGLVVLVGAGALVYGALAMATGILSRAELAALRRRRG